jgi:hypothetical protein
MCKLASGPCLKRCRGVMGGNNKRCSDNLRVADKVASKDNGRKITKTRITPILQSSRESAQYLLNLLAVNIYVFNLWHDLLVFQW